jgi:hypothetical protein
MNIAHHVAWFFGGAFLLNAIPHVVAGTMGEAFQSPFATPPGEGRSSSTVNVLWGFFNALVAWVLLVRVGSFDLRAPDHALAAGLGAFLLAVVMAPRFGRFNGGNLSKPAPE